MAKANPLKKLQRMLDDPQRLMSAISGSLAEETVNMIKDGFRAETDPYGDRWKPKKYPDGRKTLSGPTSRLKTGWHIKAQNGSGFVVAPAVGYAAAHQDPGRTGDGKLRRPRRMMVPSAERGLPEHWARAYGEVTIDALRVLLAGSSADIGRLAKKVGIEMAKAGNE